MNLFPKSDSDKAANTSLCAKGIKPAQPEVAGAFDAFVSLEDIAPDTDWSEALADAWGISIQSSKPDRA